MGLSSASQHGRLPPGKLLALDIIDGRLRTCNFLIASKPRSKGWRIRYTGGKQTAIDGPFTETKELVAGYAPIQVRTREEAFEWSRRFPNPMGKGNEAERD
jgi:hypothetical protein